MPPIVRSRVPRHPMRRGPEDKQVKIFPAAKAEVRRFRPFRRRRPQVLAGGAVKDEKRRRNVVVVRANGEGVFAQVGDGRDAPSGGNDALARVLAIHIRQHKSHRANIAERHRPLNELRGQFVILPERRVAHHQHGFAAGVDLKSQPVGFLHFGVFGGNVQSDFSPMRHRV